MIVLLTDRLTNKTHIKYFKFGGIKTLTYCDKFLLDVYANTYAASGLIHLFCKRCLAVFTRYQSSDFRSLNGLLNYNLEGNYLPPSRIDEKFDNLSGVYWKKINMYRGKLSKQNKYYDKKNKVFKSKKISKSK